VGGLGREATTPEILAGLAELLRDQNSSVRTAAVLAVRKLSSAAATLEILASLAELLRNQDCNVQLAARVVGDLRSAAATPEILTSLAELLRNQDRYVRLAAVDAVGKFGAAAATPEFLARLADLLNAAPEGLACVSLTLAHLARHIGLRFVRRGDKIVPRRLAALVSGCEDQEDCP
jgi:HEAT repeat protein